MANYLELATTMLPTEKSATNLVMMELNDTNEGTEDKRFCRLRYHLGKAILLTQHKLISQSQNPPQSPNLCASYVVILIL